TPSARSAGTTLPGTTGTTGATGTTGTAGAALTWAARAVALPAGTVPLTALARRPRGRDRLPGGRCGRHPCLPGHALRRAAWPALSLGLGPIPPCARHRLPLGPSAS